MDQETERMTAADPVINIAGEKIAPGLFTPIEWLASKCIYWGIR
ncbi:hypothetical protein EI42_02740 [Thermosporothrix hazakensis]|jgi:hypothetical protein|uniref:Uncharacterized protein n=2 Tax=Thermosporothrix TaxID=768650 RepID=A0A326U646_THEHA|nr:hypothetical protein [Thermosporothrix hazakensis]PZW29446.1 hypothetical protein EI42_02740 [Thermosporothrix hazakensis]BBH85732.1 hypothetical protein KTC_04830 [Thermosporothrix sp. COM3]GCE45839.1 hypothetical protein KTH_07080 [Thermosporothrix hazakensis]